jgi:hypothetical protein
MSRNLSDQQFKQLPMFMSARDIKANYDPLPGDREVVGDGWTGARDETNDEVWERKAEEAENDGLYDDIVNRGAVTHPVHLSAMDAGGKANSRARLGHDNEQVLGGHHRIAVMGEEAPDDLIPVLHHRNIFEAQGHPQGNFASVQVGRPYPYT